MNGRGEATAYGAVTIVNALATGKGAAFGIDLWTKATVELSDDKTIETIILNEKNENTLLVEKCVRAVLDRIWRENARRKSANRVDYPDR